MAYKSIDSEYYSDPTNYIQDTLNGIGYYSTVGIIKYTNQPTVIIADFISGIINSGKSVYVGEYFNSDDSEKVYQYKFTLYSFTGTELETTGWKIHNTYEDKEENYSSDNYSFKYYITTSSTFLVQYSIITVNGLQYNSPKYLMTAATTLSSSLQGTFSAALDYENGCVDLSIKPATDASGSPVAETGAFILLRRSSRDNYSTQATIYNFSLIGEVPSGKIFTDYTVEHGLTYKYSIQQWNNENIHSNEVTTPAITVYFEDAFLYDGERQLRIRFNAKISSFKTVLAETKKDTIGNKYPFFFKNSAIGYKEFPISGLVSYLMDNDEHFYSREELGFVNYEDSYNQTDENIALERLFKLKVLDWLNNGGTKLFKSPQEGNYLVRLMNISLAPNEVLGRMLHTFSCTADEIADSADDSNLEKFKLLNLNNIQLKRMRYSTIVFKDWIDMYIAGGKTISNLVNLDMTNGESLYHIKVQNAYPGTIFRLGQQTFAVGATGQYEILLDEPMYGFSLQSPSLKMPGEMTYGTLTAVVSYFDLVDSVNLVDIPLHQEFGPIDNLLEEFVDLKHEIDSIYYMRFTKLDTQELSESFYASLMNNTSLIKELSQYNLYKYHNVYYKVNGSSLEQVDGSTKVYFDDTEIDLAERGTINYTSDIEVPKIIKVGSGVTCEVSMRTKVINYGIESTLSASRNKYLLWKENYLAAQQGYYLIPKDTNGKNSNIENYKDSGLFVFKSSIENFFTLNSIDYEEYIKSTINIWTASLTHDPTYTIEYAKPEYVAAKAEYYEMLTAALEEAAVIK